SNTGGSGIASIDCDYLTSDHNLINHNGYIPSGTANPQWYSWTSAISYNSNQWFDNYAGFHNIISNNIISGEVDQSTHHTDGNGIILDLSSGSYDPSTANTPPALILNNVVYANALAPSLLSTGLTLLPTSPAYNRGIDPSTLSVLPANIVSDLKKYIYTDINGKARPQGGGVDLGAYQH